MARHAKTDSDVTSLAASTPPRSPRGRPAYYVLSPAASHPDVHLGASGRAAEKMSLAGSTPAESPLHYHFHRTATTTRAPAPRAAPAACTTPGSPPRGGSSSRTSSAPAATSPPW